MSPTPLPKRPLREESSTESLHVIMNCQAWLPFTQNWIHTQASFLPEWLTPHIVCFEESNASAFPQDHLHCYNKLPIIRRLQMLLASFAIAGYRTGRHKALLHHVIRNEKIRVVHSHFGYVAHAFAPFLHQLRIPHIATFYGVDMSLLPESDPTWAPRYRRMFTLVDRVLCEGPQMLKKLEELGCPTKKLVLHRLGVDLQQLPFKPRAWSKEQPLRVLIASSFKEKKGIPYALRALSAISNTVTLEITIIGDSDGSLRSSTEKTRILETLAETGLSSSTRLLGFVPHNEMIKEAYSHHLYMATSVTARDGDSEGGAPVSLIEMAATGILIVSSRHADIPDVILDDTTGLLANERDVTEIANRLAELVESPDRWPHLAAASRKRIETLFCAVRQGDRLANIYSHVSTDHQPGAS